MILSALAETGARPERTLMIGDTTYDMEMARRAGVTGLGVAWGYHARADLELAGARLVVERSQELAGVLDALLGLME
jgi:phosphoglycolate phosphatase